ncbi:MAG: hypothetical protein P8N76_09585 [Pirellulaceae bacterium]|nr:hypothetical protein [Pirellulaceae bacterium]
MPQRHTLRALAASLDLIFPAVKSWLAGEDASAIPVVDLHDQ